jgi:membrane protease YdiL (CAAX protease family)
LRPSRAIGLYAIAVILLGAAFAPWLFWGVQRLATGTVFAEYPFHRVFDRSIMIVALAGLWPLLGILGLCSWSNLGYARAPGWWRHLLAGFILGVGSLALIVVVTVVLGFRPTHFDKSAGDVAGAVLQYLLVGIAVALVEETFFRGVLQGAWQRQMNAVLAVVLASVVYSALHFLKPNLVKISVGQVSWDSGFTCLAGIVTQSYRDRDSVVGFVTLFLAGCVLGLAYYRTRALYLPIGLHAGWVLANEFARWLGGGSVIDYATCWPMLLLLLVLMARLCRTTFKPLRTGTPSVAGPGGLST